jgi:hypothetical protein
VERKLDKRRNVLNASDAAQKQNKKIPEQTHTLQKQNYQRKNTQVNG